MREPKFRFFCHTTRFMGEVKNIDFDYNTAIVRFDYAHKETPDDEIQLSSGTLMQFTGLFDKQGVEIYEGDIIREGQEDVYSAVEWVDGQFMTYDTFFLTKDEAKDLTVVGNIFENPELLKDDK